MMKSKNNKLKIDKINQELWSKRFANSEVVVAESLKILEKSQKEGYHKGEAYAILNIAAANFLQSKNDTALKYLSESFGWFENNKNETGYINALLLKGNIYESFGDYEKTLHLWLEAYKASVDAGDRESEGEACNQLGLIYSRLCNFPKAIEFFNKGLKIREELGDENAAASSLNRLGMVCRQMKNYKDSLGYYSRSLEIRKRNKQISAIPWTLLGMASTYEEMEEYHEALKIYEKGMKGADKRCTTQCMMGAGRVLSRMGNSDLAEKRLEKSLAMARELNSLALITDAYSALASHYELSGKPEKALKSFKQYLKTRETLHSSEVQIRLSNIEVAHAVEKSEQEKEIYRLRHVELKKAYDIIEEKNRDITASINYASRIQRALLPNPSDIRGLASKLFILYFPKDIVSGDFYWFAQVNKKLVIVAADCTGHGVPGALMSMLGISFLEEIVNSRGITESGHILNELRREIKRALHQKGASLEQKDGMDIALCVINKQQNSLQYSGAFNSLYIAGNNSITEYPADRMPIGIFEKSDNKFTTNNIQIAPGDMIYMFSDGYADQFGGPENRKFKYSRFRELLLTLHKLPLNDQKKKLEKAFSDWKGSNPQIDDV
ncbi:MAG: tetratricopeptide repeat protein, partial [Bacteroidales bacterium]|nr:tetratricopeptide repeat protein [Bacteroidales bacterium]